MIFFGLSILFYLLQNFSNKHFGNSVGSSSTAITLVQNGICVLFSAISFFIINGASLMSAHMMLLAVTFGMLYLLTLFLLLKAFTLGSLGGSTLLCNVGMFISAFYGIVRFGDTFTPFIGMGILLLLVAVILSVPKDEDGKKGGIKWFITALASGLANGAVASVKREAVALCPENIQNFLLWGFFFAAIIAFLIVFMNTENRRQAACVLSKPVLVMCGVFAGLGTAWANFFQMAAIRTVSSAIIYPLTSGFLVVSLWLVSLLIYRETTLKLRNILAIVCCVAAIVLMNIKG